MAQKQHGFSQNTSQKAGCMGNIPHPDLLSIVRREKERSILGKKMYSKKLLTVEKTREKQNQGKFIKTPVC